jgi:hypothetical protein
LDEDEDPKDLDECLSLFSDRAKHSRETMSLALENRKEWLFNKSETRAVFSRVLVFLNPQVLSITSSVRLSIMIMEKFPSSILIVALNPYLQYNWIINSSIVMFLPMNSENEPALLILDF